MTTDLEYDYVNQEPVLVTAGTTWKWDRSYSDFKSDTYTLTYYFRESAGKSSFNIVAAANGNNFRITVPKATSKAYMAGIYTGQGFVESATERYQVYDGSIEIQPDYSLVSDGQDFRTHNEKVLEQIKALLENKFVDDASSYSIAGRSLTKMSITELYDHKLFYEREVVMDQRRNRAKRGLPTGQIIYGKFNSGV